MLLSFYLEQEIASAFSAADETKKDNILRGAINTQPEKPDTIVTQYCFKKR